MSIIASAALFIGVTAYAQTSLPQNITIEGRFYDNGTVPMNEPVDVQFEVLVPGGSPNPCVLYSEYHLNVQVGATTPASQGYFSLALGSGTSVANQMDNFAKVFSNEENVAAIGGDCASVASLANKPRVVRISVRKTANPLDPYSTLSPDTVLTSVPTALVAETLTGKTAGEFVQVKDDMATRLSQTNIETVFSSTNYVRLLQLLSTSAPLSMGNQRISNLAPPTDAQDAATKSYTDTNIGGRAVGIGTTELSSSAGGGKVLTWDQTANSWVATAPSTAGAAGGDLTGSYPNPTIGALAVGTSKIADNAITTAKINNVDVATNRLLVTDATTGATVTYANCANNEILRFVSGTGWQCATVASMSAVTSVAGKSGAVTLNAADISGLGSAAVRNIGVASTEVPELDVGGKLNVSTIPNFSGDVTGAYSNAFVARLQGREIANIAPAPSDVLRWNGSRWEPSAITDNVGITALNGDITAAGTGLVAATINNSAITTPKMFATPGANRLVATDTTSGATLVPFVCNLDETMKWTAGGWACSTVSTLLGSQFIVDGGNTRGAAISIGTSDNFNLNFETNNATRMTILTSGFVGIGTTLPNRLFEVAGPIRIAPAALPDSPAAGDLAFDSAASNALKFFNGTAWQSVNTGSGFALAGANADVTSLNALTAINGASLAIGNSATTTLNVGGAATGALTSTFGANTSTSTSTLQSGTGGTTVSSVGVGTSAVNLQVNGVNGGIRLSPNGTGVVTSTRPIQITPTTLPAGTTAGLVAVDSSASNTLKYHNGSAWVTLGSGSGDFLANGSVPMTDQFRSFAGTAAAPGMTFIGDTNTGVFSPAADNVAIGTSGAERLRVLANGNVGIGTTNPSMRLHIVDPATVPSGDYRKIMTAHNPGLGNGAFSQLAWGHSDTLLNQAEFNFFFHGSGSDQNSLHFGLWGQANILVLRGTGNVGIGTTSPNRRLEVAGPVRISPAALPGSPGAGDLATDSGASNSLKFYDGTEWRPISGRTSCPAGFSLVGTSGSSEAFCISTNEETPLNWVNAVTNCANKTPNARLCSIDEWAHACVKVAASGMTDGNGEWVADLLTGPNPDARAMGTASGSCVENDAFPATSTRRSRCCFR